MQCEHRLWREGRLRECARRVGVHVWYDARGDLHAACADHIAARLHRYPEADPPEPVWLHELPETADPVTAAKGYREGYTDAGYTESEARMLWGDR